jgi:hypothetical protein
VPASPGNHVLVSYRPVLPVFGEPKLLQADVKGFTKAGLTQVRGLRWGGTTRIGVILCGWWGTADKPEEPVKADVGGNGRAWFKLVVAPAAAGAEARLRYILRT